MGETALVLVVVAVGRAVVRAMGRVDVVVRLEAVVTLRAGLRPILSLKALPPLPLEGAGVGPIRQRSEADSNSNDDSLLLR